MRRFFASLFLSMFFVGIALAQTGAPTFITNSTNLLTGANFNIDGSGKLAWLIAAPTTNVAGLTVQQTTFGSPTADILDITNSDGTINYFNLSSLGNVGIGTTAPAAMLSVGTGSALQVDASGNLSTSGAISTTSATGVTASLFKGADVAAPNTTLFRGGNSTGSNTGGEIAIDAGQGGSTGTGGFVTINGGFGGTTSGAGGSTQIAAGNAIGGGNGGALVLLGGNGSGNNFGGNAQLTGGAGGNGGGSGIGGDVFVAGGNAGTGAGAAGGHVSIIGGSSNTSTAGGGVSVIGGRPGTTGTGGLAMLQGGPGGSTSGSGGNVAISGGAGIGMNANGGNIFLTPGAATGTGTVGIVSIPSGTLTVANPISGSVTGNAANVTGIVAVANGGTGTGSAPTQWGIIYAASTTGYASTSAGSSGQVLTSNATSAPTFQTPSIPNFTSNLYTASPYSSTSAAVQLLATDATATNITVALTPVGTGALEAQIADGTTTNGNIRGASAVDWQTTRAAITEVASGTQSVIGGGADNTATGGQSTIAGGQQNVASNTWATVAGGLGNTASAFGSTVAGGASNTANGDFSTIAGGSGAKTSHYGQNAQASGVFAAAGDAQTSVYTAFDSTSSATAKNLHLDGPYETSNLTVPTNSSWMYHVMLVARQSGGTTSDAWDLKGLAVNHTGILTLTQVATTEIGSSGWSVIATTSGTNLVIQVTGAASTNIQWVARIETVETIY